MKKLSIKLLIATAIFAVFLAINATVLDKTGSPIGVEEGVPVLIIWYIVIKVGGAVGGALAERIHSEEDV